MTQVHMAMASAVRYQPRVVPAGMTYDEMLAALDEMGKINRDDEGEMILGDWDEDTVRDILAGIPEAVGVLDDAPRVMDISVSPVSDLVASVSEVLTCWAEQSSDEAPMWISSDDPILEAALKDAFDWRTDLEPERDGDGYIIEHEVDGAWVPVMRSVRTRVADVPLGVPDDVETTSYTLAGAPGTDDGTEWGGLVKASRRRVSRRKTLGPGATLMVVTIMLAAWVALTNLLHTSAGIDHLSRVGFDTASNGTSSYAAANYIALTENATAPASGDTALTGELSGSGWTRAQATYAHTNGTATVTLTKTFTSADASARTINKAGLFNASSVGTMAYETAMPSPPTLVSGDLIAITWTFTIS